MAPKENIAAQEKSLERYLGWIRQSDAKAQMLIAINLVQISAVLANSPKQPEFARHFVSVALIIAFGAGLQVWNLERCFSAVSPKVKGADKSLIFFGNVARQTLDVYRDSVHARTESEYLDDLITQCHINADIADKKYQKIKTAAVWTARSFMPMLASVLVLFMKWYQKIGF